MTDYVTPLRDMDFVLTELLNLDGIQDIDGFDEVSNDLIVPVLDEAAKLIQKTIAPLNRSGDEEGCRYDEGKVFTPAGFKEAYQTYAESGWISLAQDPEYGGQGLPYVLSVPVSEMLCSANTALSLYPGISRGVYEAIHLNASDELKQRYLPSLSSGLWTGTMCISEPQAGTDIGAIRTKVSKQEDGSYRVTGNKTWITGGEHDLTEQIVHLVLARTEDAPEGVRGLSLFVVPKFKVTDDGTLAEANNVNCAGIEHKMGINASATCVLNFEDSQGYLVGELHAGIKYMFTVMNFERFEISLQGMGIAEHATQNAIGYAKERLQGYSFDKNKDNTKPVAIIQHPDIKRQLMTMKAYTEGMRMLAYDTALNFDKSMNHQDAEQKQFAQDLVDLMIPVCKSLFTDLGVEISSMALQVFGGNGYTREYGMEQNMRDARIGSIYEGTNAVQALDLVRRKLTMNNGRLPANFFAEVKCFLSEIKDNESLSFIHPPLSSILVRLEQATLWLQENNKTNADGVALGASEYLRAFGLVTLGYWWAKAAHVACTKDDVFSKAKMETARFYAQRLLVSPVESLLAVVMSPCEIDEELI